METMLKIIYAISFDTIANNFEDDMNVFEDHDLDFYVLAYRSWYSKIIVWSWCFFRSMVPIKILMKKRNHKSKYEFFNECIKKIDDENKGIYVIYFVINDPYIHKYITGKDLKHSLSILRYNDFIDLMNKKEIKELKKQRNVEKNG